MVMVIIVSYIGNGGDLRVNNEEPHQKGMSSAAVQLQQGSVLGWVKYLWKEREFQLLGRLNFR